MHPLNPSKQSALVLTGLMSALLIALATTMVRADDEADYDDLRRRLKSAYRSANYEKALEVAEKMHEQRDDDVEIMYNIACLNCLLGEKEKAYTWLEKTIDAGYRDANFLVNDYDFRTIRGEDRFQQLIRKMRQRSTVSRDKGKTKSDKKNPDRKKSAEKSDDSDEIDVPDLQPRERRAKIGELTQKLIDAAGKGDKAKALKLALEARAHAKILYNEFKDHEQFGPGVKGQYSLTCYNSACMYSLRDEKAKAFKCLNKAIDLGGFNNNIAASIEGDSDFDNIRDDPRYKKALKKAKKVRRPRPQPQRAREEQSRRKEEVGFEWKVTLPEDYDKSRPAPLLVALHHYHGTMDKTAQRWKEAADEIGAVLLTPQGTYEFGNGYEWGDDLDVIEENVMDAINKVMDKHKIDKDKIVLTGFSQGGWATWALALRNPDAFCGIIPVAGRFKFESESDFEDEDLAGLRIFVMVGEDERSRTIDSNRDAARRFKKLGAKVKLNIYEDVGHSFPDNETEEQIKALRFVLKS